jgi:GNAT superfamily N-acetyltransferase
MSVPTDAFLTLAPENLENQHICCAISGAHHAQGVERKKAFLSSGFGKGLVFRKLDARGKVFIEYAPAESAWRPVVAPGYLVIHCLWVSGKFKAKKLGRELLQHCLDAVGERRGVVAVSGRKPYLTDTRFYLHHGFELIESTETGFDLVCYRSDRSVPTPRLTERARRGTVSQDKGVHFEYSCQCPFVPKCLRDMSDVARELGQAVTATELDTVEKAQNAASPFGTFGAFLHGRLITHELMSPRKFRTVLAKKLELRGAPEVDAVETPLPA